MKIRAPWTDKQVEALNQWQKGGLFHEFTCPNSHSEDRTLKATRDGWVCLYCGYRQDWAHDFMVETGD